VRLPRFLWIPRFLKINRSAWKAFREGIFAQGEMKGGGDIVSIGCCWAWAGVAAAVETKKGRSVSSACLWTHMCTPRLLVHDCGEIIAHHERARAVFALRDFRHPFFVRRGTAHCTSCNHFGRRVVIVVVVVASLCVLLRNPAPSSRSSGGQRLKSNGHPVYSGGVRRRILDRPVEELRPSNSHELYYCRALDGV